MNLIPDLDLDLSPQPTIEWTNRPNQFRTTLGDFLAVVWQDHDGWSWIVSSVNPNDPQFRRIVASGHEDSAEQAKAWAERAIGERSETCHRP